MNHNAQREAAADALRAFQAATVAQRRARIIAEVDNGGGSYEQTDVTEHVVSLLDMITMSMDWGSDFWTDTDLPSFIELCKLLRFTELPDAPPAAVLPGEDGDPR